MLELRGQENLKNGYNNSLSGFGSSRARLERPGARRERDSPRAPDVEKQCESELR